MPANSSEPPLDPGATARAASRSFAYDVAISYASPDFALAESLATLLERRGLRVFFDRHPTADLFGAELGSRLDDVFEAEAGTVVIIGSQSYGTSEWTCRELAAARRRLASSRHGACVLPISVDGTWVPGLERLAHLRLRPLNRPILSDDELAELVYAGLAPLTTVVPEHADPLSRPESNTPMTQWHPSPQKDERLNVQPTVSLNAAGAGSVVSTVDSRTRVDNRKGLGAMGIVFILVVVVGAVGAMAWLAFDFVRNAPRNADGTVTFLGIHLPPSIVGAAQSAASPNGAAARTTQREVEPDGPPASPGTPAGAPTTEALQGLWVCSNGATVTFTETRRVALTRSGVQGEQIFEGSPFVTWKATPYAFVAARTIKVGDTEADLELTEDGREIRLIGGMVHMDCRKQRI